MESQPLRQNAQGLMHRADLKSGQLDSSLIVAPGSAFDKVGYLFGERCLLGLRVVQYLILVWSDLEVIQLKFTDLIC